MLIGHASDLHGEYTALYSNTRVPDLWVLSGDMLPNRPMFGFERSIQPYKERPYQRQVMLEEGPALAKVFKDRPVLVVDGNHDFVPFTEGLRDAGVDATELTTKPNVRFGGLTFSGFPFITWIAGEWNHERMDLQPVVDEVFEDPPDVLVTHAPPSGILDRGMTGGRYGIPALTSALAYKPHRIRAHLFGHVHGSFATHEEFGILFSNAATGLRFLEIP